MSEEPPRPVSETAPAENPPAPASEDDIEEYEPLTPELVEEEAIRGDFVMKWAVVLLAFLLGSTRIGETATLVHVKTGQYLASHGILPPANDVFSYTASDRPWTNLAWGFDLLAAGVYALGAFIGLSVIKALLAAVIFGVLVHISRSDSPTWWGSVCAVLALLACHLRLTAQPTLMTLLGTALVLWILHRSRETPAAGRWLWSLPAVFFLWSNLDSRAFLGLGLLVLYAVGESLRPARSGSSPQAVRPGLLWMVAAASCVATLFHPFGYKSLLAPLYVYGVEYPALREYIGGKYLGVAAPVAVAWPPLMYFPMTNGSFWAQLDLASVCALLLLAATTVLFILNRARVETWQFLMFLASVVLAAVSLHELPWASLVWCVLATLLGQSWYRATFRQTYSLDTTELVFSRGGRVVTVVAFAAIAFFGGTGRLREVRAPRSGFGIDPALQASILDMESQAAAERGFDHKPFNQFLTQGDVLIWVGEQVFADSRVGVYHSRQDQKNLLRTHVQTREALRPARRRAAGGGVADARRAWKPTLDDYKVTHVVLRMSPDLSSSIDYETLVELLHDGESTTESATAKPPVWEMTELGATAAVLYRRDVENLGFDEEARKKYEQHLDEHKVDFHRLAFEVEGPEILPRSDRVHPPSFYQKYFWSKKPEVTPEVQAALHLVRLASIHPVEPFQLPLRYEDDKDALAFLAIRQAQAGLDKDPDSVLGYLALGQAYQLLAEIEALNSLGSRTPYNGTRYLQSVAAFHQALIADPDNRTAHLGLSRLYQGARRPELALRHLEALEQLLANEPGTVNNELLTKLRDEISIYYEQLAVFKNELAQMPPGIDRILRAIGRGCSLQALTDFDELAQPMNMPPEFEKLRISLMLECGRVNDAADAAERFAEIAPATGAEDWAHVVAICRLTQSDYPGAMKLWDLEADNLSKTRLNNALVALTPRKTILTWPLSTLQGGLDLLYKLPDELGARDMEIALAAIEQGRLSTAKERFHQVLEEDPETSSRGLIAYYLSVLTEEEIEPFPPSESVPALFAPEPGTEPQPAADQPVDR